MNSRDRILVTLKKGIPDRVGNHEHVWGETEKLWHQQGLPEKTSSAQYFDYESLPKVRMPKGDGEIEVYKALEVKK